MQEPNVPEAANISSSSLDHPVYLLSKDVKDAAAEVQVRASNLLSTNVELSTLDIRALAGMNQSATVFYKAMSDRSVGLQHAAAAAAKHNDHAHVIAADMERVKRSALRLEALIDRLDEYTLRLEQGLGH